LQAGHSISRDGKASLTRFPKILHAEYPLGEAFHIANVAQSGDDSPKVVVASRVDPAGEKDAYKIAFSELGWPPAYSGQTSLAIRPQDRRVLRLPAIDCGQSAMLETMVLIQYKIRDQTARNRALRSIRTIGLPEDLSWSNIQQRKH
jgi:hypothetical protein